MSTSFLYSHINKPVWLLSFKFIFILQKAPWKEQNKSTTLTGYLSGLTFLSEGNLSSDGVDEEHLTGGNPGRLLHQAEPQLSVDRAALITIQRLHLHERYPWNPGGAIKNVTLWLTDVSPRHKLNAHHLFAFTQKRTEDELYQSEGQNQRCKSIWSICLVL